MKTLKFFLMAFVAVALFSCEPKTTEPSFSVTYEGQVIKDGDVLDVTMDHYEWGEIVAHVVLKNNASDAKTFTMKEVRNYDYAKYVPSFCVDLCMMGNGEKEQTWEVGELGSGEEFADLAMHLRVDGQPAANCPGQFTFSNGSESLTFTLNFVYDPAAIPAE